MSTISLTVICYFLGILTGLVITEILGQITEK